jgi:hypothetical protein
MDKNSKIEEGTGKLIFNCAVPNACNIQCNFIASFTGMMELLVSLMRTQAHLILAPVLLFTYFMHGV